MQDTSEYGGMSDSFGEKAVRLGFIRKVYSILCAQLTLTLGIIGVFTVDSVKTYATGSGQWMFWVALVVMLVTLFSMACCSSVRRQTPHNYIFLALFTAAEGFLLGMATSTYSVPEILMAVGVCAAVVLALTLFAFQTKIDFTACGGVLLACLVVFMIFGFIAIFLPEQRTVKIVYAAIGTLIFSLYIVYDTQLMVGGKHKYSLSPEEYVFAALNLYLDIINLFMYILQLVGAARN
jgi:FtsH-binding integral membrane protein